MLLAESCVPRTPYCDLQSHPDSFPHLITSLLVRSHMFIYHMMPVVCQCSYCLFSCLQHYIRTDIQVATLAVHMCVQANKLWVHISLSTRVWHWFFDLAIRPCHLEDGSWFTCKMHQFTLAKHTLAPQLGCVSSPWERQATFLSDNSSIQLYKRGAWRYSQLRKVVDDQQLNTNTHTYMYFPYGHVTDDDLSAALVGEDRWVEWRLFYSSSSYIAWTNKFTYHALHGHINP